MAVEQISPIAGDDKKMEFNLATAGHREAIVAVGKALSSPVRIDILNVIKVKPLPVQEIARVLHLPLSSVSMHIRCLEDAGLISTRMQPGRHGSMRLCTCDCVSLHIETYDTDVDAQDHTVVFDMPVGNFSAFEISPTCGLAGMDGIIDTFDDPVSFYSTERQQAQLVWFHSGFVEYRFPNRINSHLELRELSFSLEVCSEHPGFNEDWPSDITFSVNGWEVGTYTVPGDFGLRRGKLTPDVWPMGRSQYGLMVYVSIREDGGYINKRRVNPDIRLGRMKLYHSSCVSFEVRVKEEARNCRGVNIFGEKYGDYPQGICMRIVY